MYLSRQEVADFLGVSESYVRKVIDSGKTQLSRHLKCSDRPPRRGDPAPVRISARDLALFALTHTRLGWEGRRGEDQLGEGEIEAKVREIWEWVAWHRERVVETPPSDPIGEGRRPVLGGARGSKNTPLGRPEKPRSC